ncbi:HK97 family phage prohead protease [Holdemania sp. 1001302B_160321_E10]|uniref:HK97 family phage prohead protease n=1 Tax=Holdemania sp. 1001302B_160321_E10 TaxID=2787120 RepID=UPI00189B2313|nr:HK97 family phage prohead protease [Holdemania sp. 1001302B_160321_E10]
MEKRTLTLKNENFKTREENGEMRIEGYFSVFNSRYELCDGAYEVVLPGAFDGETKKDVRALINHDSTLVLGRTTAGTLELREDDYGLWGSILINGSDQDAVNLYERVKRGDVDQCSFGFNIVDEDIECSDGNPTVWKIKKVRLYEVSVVTFPAYEATSVQARKNEIENIKKRQIESWRFSMLKKLKGEKENA